MLQKPLRLSIAISLLGSLAACVSNGGAVVGNGIILAGGTNNVSNYKISRAPIVKLGAFMADGSTFIFKLDKGDVGNCNTDTRSYSDANVPYKHSERQEITFPLYKGLTPLTYLACKGLSAWLV